MIADGDVTGDGDEVTTWSDQTVNDNDAVEISGAGSPTYKTRLIECLPAVRFESSEDDALGADGVAAALDGSDVPFTLIAVKRDRTAGEQTAWGLDDAGVSGGAESLFGNSVDGVTRRDDTEAGDANLDYPNSSVFEVVSYVFDGTDAEIYVNGVLADSGPADVGTCSFDAFTIGAARQPGSSPIRLASDIDLACLVTYDAALSTADREAAEDCLMKKYGMRSCDSSSSSVSCDVACPELQEVTVYREADPYTCQEAPLYFKAPFSERRAVLLAKVSDADACCRLTYRSTGGADCIAGVVEPYDGEWPDGPSSSAAGPGHCPFLVRLPPAAGPDSSSSSSSSGSEMDEEGPATVCVEILCDGEVLWTGKVEFYQLQEICLTCPAIPSLGDPAPVYAPVDAAAPGRLIAPDDGFLTGHDPRAWVQQAGPAFFRADGRLGIRFEEPAGSPLDPQVLAGYEASTQFDTPQGYGWINSFSRRLWSLCFGESDGGTSSSSSSFTSGEAGPTVHLLTETGTVLTYVPDGLTGGYTPPDGAYSSLERTASGYLERSTVDNRTWEYDDDGFLTKITRGAAEWTVTHTTIDGFTLPETVTAPGGQTTTLNYQSGNPPRLTSIDHPGGRTTAFSYSDRHLVSYQQPGQSPTQFTFGGPAGNNLERITLPGGQIYTYTYHGDHRLARMQDPEGNLTTYDYPSASTAVIVDPLDRRTTISHDGSERALVTSVDRSGNAWSFSWNQGYPTRIQDPLLRKFRFAYRTAESGPLQLAGVGELPLFEEQGGGPCGLAQVALGRWGVEARGWVAQPGPRLIPP